MLHGSKWPCFASLDPLAISHRSFVAFMCKIIFSHNFGFDNVDDDNYLSDDGLEKSEFIRIFFIVLFQKLHIYGSGDFSEYYSTTDWAISSGLLNFFQSIFKEFFSLHTFFKEFVNVFFFRKNWYSFMSLINSDELKYLQEVVLYRVISQKIKPGFVK